MVNLIADFVVRFNSGIKKNTQYVYVPYSHTVVKIVRLLFSYNCISSFSIDSDTNKSFLRIKIVLLYVENTSLMKKLEIVSTPGLRVY